MGISWKIRIACSGVSRIALDDVPHDGGVEDIGSDWMGMVEAIELWYRPRVPVGCIQFNMPRIRGSMCRWGRCRHGPVVRILDIVLRKRTRSGFGTDGRRRGSSGTRWTERGVVCPGGMATRRGCRRCPRCPVACSRHVYRPTGSGCFQEASRRSRSSARACTASICARSPNAARPPGRHRRVA